jgi:enamine deaminase RidA (YjgF/YER057c/UK114 family)
MTPEQRLEQLGITLPIICKPRGNFDAWILDGALLYLSGNGASLRQQITTVPKVGREISTQQAQDYAREVGLHLIAHMHQALGDLSRVRRIVKVFGMINAAPDFMEHTEVINGCSDVLVQVFGALGRHSRSAIGVSSLPRGFAVEIEAVVAIKD